MNLLSVLLQVSSEISTSIAAFSAALVAIGAAFGLGKIGLSAMEAIARQPQASNDIRTAMILIAAFVEGVALFALVICILALS